MPRLARIVVPGLPHHVIQRGNRRQQTFFCQDDYRRYLDLLFEFAALYAVEVWAYCLMPNHVHHILAPCDKLGLGKLVRQVHRRYTRAIHFREGWRGYFWQGRFRSFVMDDAYTFAAARYILRNPVRSKLVRRAEDWAPSSARVHLNLEQNPKLTTHALDKIVGDYASLLQTPSQAEVMDRLRKHERTGRAAGSEQFIGMLETKLGKSLRLKKPGRKPASK